MSKQYLTPKISCIICHKEYSAKGIFSHFFASHDTIGIVIMQKIRNKGTDKSFRNPGFRSRHKPVAKPKHPCGNPDCHNLTKTKFCSHHCSAVVSNKNRTKESYTKAAKTLLENKINAGWTPKIRKSKYIPSLPKQRICSVCGKVDETRARFQSDKCSFCNDSLTYRESCKFTFNLKDYPDEFDLSLLSKHGMFNPRTNQKGVSRDHLLSIHYGKTNRVDPKIMSHPANCQLILHSENKRKQHFSSITLEELLIRIAAWDAKYKEAGSGHDPDSEGL